MNEIKTSVAAQVAALPGLSTMICATVGPVFLVVQPSQPGLPRVTHCL